MFVVLIAGRGLTWHDDDWSTAAVLADPSTGHPFPTFISAFNHADAFIERDWTIAQLDTDVSKP